MKVRERQAAARALRKMARRFYRHMLAWGFSLFDREVIRDDLNREADRLLAPTRKRKGRTGKGRR